MTCGVKVHKWHKIPADIGVGCQTGFLRRPKTYPRRQCIIVRPLAASSVQNQLNASQEEAQRRLDKAVGLINTADLLAPFDRSAYSAPLVIW